MLSTSYLGNSIEQFLWTTTVALVAIALGWLGLRAEGSLRAFLAFSVVARLGFAAFMTTVDVPMHVTRWLADEASGRAYLTLAAGVRDVSTRWVVTHSWTDWHEEIAWMSLYFSVAVWFSIALVHAPRAASARSMDAREPVTAAHLFVPY